MESDDAFLHAVTRHDEAVARLNQPIWIGAEPTYTDRWSEMPEWLYCALGDDKRERAGKLTARLAACMPGAAVMRCVGRQYEGEKIPRWSFGILRFRDKKPVWRGPPDPLLIESSSSWDPELPASFALRLCESLQKRDLAAETLDAPHEDRVVFRIDNTPPETDFDEQPLLVRPSVHEKHVEGVEVVDELAGEGNFLVTCNEEDEVLRVEIPKIADVGLLLKLLDALADAAGALPIASMIIAGFPPPVDETVAWMTITADPAVIEVNLAPACQTADIWCDQHALQQAAESEGLQPYRLQYTGEECDSGGGGQITLGGPSPEESPFLKIPHLLPSLVRYFNRHPSLSYLHAFESIGPGSQAPRLDEGVRSALAELRLSLDLLERTESPTPETLWNTLAPFLADSSGNTHRAEINIEKLWNPFLGGRGCLGLVEFRSFRMGPSAETTVALAAMLRSIVAMLIKNPCDEPLVDWGEQLHEQFSLPLFLQSDLQEVLADLQRSGFGLGDPIAEHLMRDGDLILTQCDLGETRLELRRAFEFWPLIGDSAIQEGGGSRLIDSSTSRLEIRLRSDSRPERLADWKVTVSDWSIPLHEFIDEEDSIFFAGLRYRSFVPQRGLHPTLPSQAPVSLTFSHPQDGAWQMTVYQWDPSGEAYPGLPETIDEARSRRRDRCVLEKLDDLPPEGIPPREEAVGTHVVDLRWR